MNHTMNHCITFENIIFSKVATMFIYYLYLFFILIYKLLLLKINQYIYILFFVII